MDHFIKVKSIKISMPAGFVLPMVRRKAVSIELETQGSELTVESCTSFAVLQLSSYEGRHYLYNHLY